MSADTLTAQGGPVTLPLPWQNAYGAQVYHVVSYAVVPGTDQIAVLSTSMDTAHNVYLVLDGYNLDGTEIYQDLVVKSASIDATGVVFGATATSSPTGDVGVTYFDPSAHKDYVALYTAAGAAEGFKGALLGTDQTPALAFHTSFGFHLEYQAGSQAPGTGQYMDYYHSGGVTALQASGSANGLPAYADISVGSSELTILDNQVSFTGQAPITLPGVAANSITDVQAAGLANGTSAAVIWSGSGAASVSIYDGRTDTFGSTVALDSGGAGGVHVVALPDGGFVVSWMKGGTYHGEVFDAAGNGGGIISLAGDVAGIDSHGDLYTVGYGQPYSGEVVQTYAISGSGGSSSGQGPGQTYTSDNSGDTWVGTAGDDTFHLGRGGDTVTGNGGDDTYLFAEIPWAGGHITDFNAGDVLNLTKLMSTTADTGTDGFADGYLKITSDSAGGAQVWAQYATSGSSSGWWLVETLDGVSASSLTHSGDTLFVQTQTGPTSVSTSDANYTAPSYVTAITLTGSRQHVDASATNGVEITSTNSGNNVLIGGAGDDTFHLGRGGDLATGGAGADTFAYAETPWAAGAITDFNASQGDRVDVRGLLSASGYTGSDPVADGYLKYVSDTGGSAELWSNIHQSGNDGWWLVTTLEGVSTSSLHYSGGFIT